METTTSNKTWYWVIAIIVIVLLAIWAFGGNDAEDNDADRSPIGTSTSSTGTDSPNSRSNSITGSNAGVSSGANGVPAIPSDATLTQIMGNSKVRVPQTGVDVALSGGQASYVSGTTKGQIALGSILSKITTDDGYDIFVNMTVTPTSVANKAAPQNYVALFHVKGDVATYTSAVIIGSGLIVKSVEAKRNPAVSVANNAYPYMDSALGYLLTVSYLDRRSGEFAPTAPTVSKDFTANVKNHIVTK